MLFFSQLSNVIFLFPILINVFAYICFKINGFAYFCNTKEMPNSLEGKVELLCNSYQLQSLWVDTDSGGCHQGVPSGLQSQEGKEGDNEEKSERGKERSKAEKHSQGLQRVPIRKVQNKIKQQSNWVQRLDGNKVVRENFWAQTCS